MPVSQGAAGYFKKQKTNYMHRQTAIRDLANLIEKNPNCKFEIDNDMWYMIDASGNEVTNSEKIQWDTRWYGNSSNYGAGIAEALIELLNRTTFNISAEAV